MNGAGGLAAWRPRIAIAALVVIVGSAAVSAAGPESPAIARMLGSGVHAYFSGDFLRSYEDLSAAVEAGSEDPRVLYFRGLSALRLGRFDEAEADFSRGADLEAAPSANWPVPRSLERVQGCDRIRLERHRARARVARLQLDRDEDRDSSSWIDSQDEVLRERRPAPGGAAGNLFDPRGEEAVEPPRTPAPEALPTPPGPQPPAEGDRDVPEERDGAEESGAPGATDREVMPPADAGGGVDAGESADAATGAAGAAEPNADEAAAGTEAATPEGGMADEGGNTGAGTDSPAAGDGMDGDAGTDAAGEGGMDGEAGGVTDGAAGDPAGGAGNPVEGDAVDGNASPTEGQ